MAKREPCPGFDCETALWRVRAAIQTLRELASGDNRQMDLHSESLCFTLELIEDEVIRADAAFKAFWDEARQSAHV